MGRRDSSATLGMTWVTVRGIGMEMGDSGGDGMGRKFSESIALPLGGKMGYSGGQWGAEWSAIEADLPQLIYPNSGIGRLSDGRDIGRWTDPFPLTD